MTQSEYIEQLKTISERYNRDVSALAEKYFNEAFEVGGLVKERDYPYTYVLDGMVLNNNGIVRNPFLVETLAIISPTKGQYFPHYETEGQCTPLHDIEKTNEYHYNSKPDKSVRGIKETNVYLMFDSANSFFKIGHSTNLTARESTLQSEKPTISLVCSGKGSLALEKTLHEKYAVKRVRGEWFRLTNTDVEEIKKILK